MLLFLLAGASQAAADQLPLVRRVDGEPIHAAFVGATADGQLEFRANDTQTALAAADLVTWGQFVDPPLAHQVVLASNGLLVSETIRLDGDNLAGASATFGEWALPVDSTAGILYRSRQRRGTISQRFRRVLEAGGRDDRLLLDNGDEIRGTLTALDTAKATLRGENGPLELKLDSIAAVVFDPSLAAARQPEGLRLLVGLQDGSRLQATRLESSGANTRLTLSSGAELTTATSWIVALQPLGGRAVYLSDLEPASYRHIPYLTLSWPFHNDRSTTGTPLRAGSHLYLKGLGMHSPARITYDLAEEFRRFEAEVAIDDAAGSRGSVLFRVFVDDGSGDWQQRATSEIMRGGQPPQSISADLTGAKRLSLLVDFADRGDELDHANWLNARLIR